MRGNLILLWAVAAVLGLFTSGGSCSGVEEGQMIQKNKGGDALVSIRGAGQPLATLAEDLQSSTRGKFSVSKKGQGKKWRRRMPKKARRLQKKRKIGRSSRPGKGKKLRKSRKSSRKSSSRKNKSKIRIRLPSLKRTVGLDRQTVLFRAYLKSALPSRDFKMLQRNQFKPASFENLSSFQLKELIRREPKSLRGFVHRMMRSFKRRFSPEPGDEAILGARLRTKQKEYKPKGKNAVADLRKALYTSDVSKTNPFEDPFAAPGGPNEGVNRKIGAYIPPKDMRDFTGKYKRHCDPIVDPLCKLKTPKPGDKLFKGSSDPDDIRHAPRMRTVVNPKYTNRGGMKIARKIRSTPIGRRGRALKKRKNNKSNTRKNNRKATASADPYASTRKVVRGIRKNMLARSASKLTFDPADPRNWLPQASKYGPKVLFHAPMSDPLPPLLERPIRSKVPRRRRNKALVSQREKELDPYASASKAYNSVTRTYLSPPPLESAEKPTHFGPGSVRGPGKAPGQLAPRSVEATQAFLTSQPFSNPDANIVRSSRSKNIKKQSLPLIDPTQQRAWNERQAPVSFVADSTRDPFPLPGDSRVAEPLYLQYPRSLSEAGDETHGSFPTEPLSYDRTNDPRPQSNRIPLKMLPWTTAPGAPTGPVGPVKDMMWPTDEAAFMHDRPNVNGPSSPFQEMEQREAAQRFHDIMMTGKIPI